MSDRQCEYELVVFFKNRDYISWGSVEPIGEPSIETAVDDISRNNEGWLDDMADEDQSHLLIDGIAEDVRAYILREWPYDKSGPKIVDTLFRL